MLGETSDISWASANPQVSLRRTRPAVVTGRGQFVRVGQSAGAYIVVAIGQVEQPQRFGLFDELMRAARKEVHRIMKPLGPVEHIEHEMIQSAQLRQDADNARWIPPPIPLQLYFESVSKSVAHDFESAGRLILVVFQFGKLQFRNILRILQGRIPLPRLRGIVRSDAQRASSPTPSPGPRAARGTPARWRGRRDGGRNDR